MVYPVHPSDPLFLHGSSESPQEKQKLFEIQFETSVLGIYVAVSGQNGSIQKQLSHVKNSLASGKSPDQLTESLNQTISQMNQSMVPGTPPFPPFQFTSEGSQRAILTNHALALKKCLNALAENGKIDPSEEQKLMGSLTHLTNHMGQLTPTQAYQQFNGIIQSANDHLSKPYHFPTFPFGEVT